MTPQQLWSRYARIWSSDAPTREREMDACLAEVPNYLDPNVALSGRKAFSDYMAGFQGGMPGCVFEITSVRHHHDRSLAAWRLVNPEGHVVFDGVSAAHHASDGRLEDISGFFATQPGTEGP